MRRLLYISYLVQSGMDASDYSVSESDIAIADKMYEYVKEHSDNFKCSYSWLLILWEAAYLKFYLT